jgi:hypothetical protein
MHSSWLCRQFVLLDRSLRHQKILDELRVLITVSFSCVFAAMLQNCWVGHLSLDKNGLTFA